MKTIYQKTLLLLLLTLNLNAFNFVDAWYRVKELDHRGKSRSALVEVDKIYNEAKKRGESLQFVKASLKRKAYVAQLSNKRTILRLESMEKSVREAPTSESKHILESILAQYYENYLYRHDSEIDRRSKEANKKHYKGVEALGIRAILERIHELYRASVSEEVKNIYIKKYASLLTSIKPIQAQRPMLYDFLLFRAMEYFSKTSSYIHLPYQNFDFNQPNLFSDRETFAYAFFNVKRSDDPQYQTMLFFQTLLRHYTQTYNFDALDEMDNRRLKYVYENTHREDKDERYVEALKRMAKADKRSLAWFNLASYYGKKDKFIEEMHYLNEILKDETNRGYHEALRVKHALETQRIEIKTEMVNQPMEHILAKISYRNLDKVYVQVRHKDEAEVLQQFTLSLPKPKKYRVASTEVTLGKYAVGEYVLSFSPNADFKRRVVEKQLIVSNLGCLRQEDNRRLLVVNRKTGEPIKQVRATLKRTGKWTFHRYSDENGFIELPRLKKRYRLSLDYFGDEIEEAGMYVDEGVEHHMAKPKKQVFLFTDRSIYRPSQRIYFKGLATKRFSDRRPRVVANETITVRLLNRNSKEIGTQTVTTDEYGSFYGSFIAPKGGLLGEMKIVSSLEGYQRISVEEYKRPKFEVKFDKRHKVYRPNEKVTLHGVAKAFAGNGLSHAKVQVRVVRNIYVPYNPKKRRNSIPQKEILVSEIETDNNGTFTFSFNAETVKGLSRDEKPAYNYGVGVTVIDGTGESHVARMNVPVSYLTFDLSFWAKSPFIVGEKNYFNLHARSEEGEVFPLQGSIKIKKYAIFNKVYRFRYWSQPFISFEKETFQRYFPNYHYNEQEAREAKLVKEISFDTTYGKKVELPTLEVGNYVAEMKTKDEQGHELVRNLSFSILDKQQKAHTSAVYVETTLDKLAYVVGDVAELKIKSSVKNIPMLLTLEKNDKILQEKWILLNKGEYTEKIKIDEAYQGNLHYRLVGVQESRTFGTQGTIFVPWETDLKVEYLSFRDKMRPNQQEQWKIKISGKNRERVMAQMLATIYDASLERLKAHNFNLPYLYPYSSMGHRIFREEAFTSDSASKSWTDPSREALNQGTFAKFKNLPEIYAHSLDRYFPQAVSGNIHPVPLVEVEPIPVPMAVMESESAEASTVQEASFAPPHASKEKKERGEEEPLAEPLNIRSDFNETMLFAPTLETDSEGNILVNFKSNEALTRWNFLALVHTKDLRMAVTKKSFVTQKELMVVSNVPRFFREKDKITLVAKVVNLTDKEQNGVCTLELKNALTHQAIFNKKFEKSVTIPKGSSVNVAFTFTVPNAQSVPAIEHTFVARTQTHSDAEQVVAPVLSNRIFITESRPFTVKGGEHKKVLFKSLRNNNSTTRQDHKLTLEFTSNPAWYAIRALPYLMEYPHECSEQLFSRYFANALAGSLIRKHPKIAEVFKSWKSKKELKSALRGNLELKKLLLEETPWVLNANNEEEQLDRLSLLFDLHRLSQEQEKTYAKILKRQAQNSDGGWAWFEAPKSNWYMTQYIVEGFGKLKRLGIDKTHTPELRKAVLFLDRELVDHYMQMLQNVIRGGTMAQENHLDSLVIHYLYTRSLYDVPMSRKLKKIYNYYLQQAITYWGVRSIHDQGIIALVLAKKGKTEEVEELLASFKERAIVDPKQGMYFKYNNGYDWSELPIETHTFMMEVYATVAKDKKALALMQKWLLNKKFKEHWKTTTATTSAIYALFAYDDSLLIHSKPIEIAFNSNTPYQKRLSDARKHAQEGTGYFKVSFEKFDKSMAELELNNPNSIEAYGALYWQYFEDLDKVKKFRETPLRLSRRVYVLRGGRYEPVDFRPLRVGDKVKVEIELKVNKTMEYVMLKDSRASTFEPLEVLSGYRYNGVGYYQSTKDAATYFFMDKLYKGVYHFSYPMVVTHKGVFSNGIASAESVYAPEFKSHSQGVRIVVE